MAMQFNVVSSVSMVSKSCSILVQSEETRWKSFQKIWHCRSRVHLARGLIVRIVCTHTTRFSNNFFSQKTILCFVSTVPTSSATMRMSVKLLSFSLTYPFLPLFVLIFLFLLLLRMLEDSTILHVVLL